MKLDQETKDRIALDNKLGYFGRMEHLLAYRLNDQKGCFVLGNEDVRIISAVVKRGRVVITVADSCTSSKTLELTFNIVEQFPEAVTQ